MLYDTVIGLGSNLGDRLLALASALRALRSIAEPTALSAVYETAPVGPPQPAFLNAALRLSVPVPPSALLDQLLAIERGLGRVREERWGPRTLDLDILWIAGYSSVTPELTVPHAELAVRPFALVPLLDVAPEATDPRTGRAYADILSTLDASTVRLISASLSADWE